MVFYRRNGSIEPGEPKKGRDESEAPAKAVNPHTPDPFFRERARANAATRREAPARGLQQQHQEDERAEAPRDLFGLPEPQQPAAAGQKHGNSVRSARRQQTRSQAAPEGQARLDGALLPFCDPIPARSLARSTPPIIEGIRADIEAEVDEAFDGQGLGGTLAEALPFGHDGDLRVIRLVELDIDLRQGPTLHQTRPGPDDPKVETTAGFWDLLAETNIGDRVEIDDNAVSVFLRGCTIWWAGIETLYWFTLNRDLVSLCQSYFRNRDNILATVDRAEKAKALAGDFALRFEDRAEWDRLQVEEESARADFNRLLSRFGRHPLYPPHFL